MSKPAFGVIVGRFQTPYLHNGHQYIIEQVTKEHENLVIFVGVQAGQSSEKNPLDFQSRKVMIQESYPSATVLPLPDMKDDFKWSRELDRRLKEAIGVNFAVLYGSRDSFIPYYHGIYRTSELVSPDVIISATAIREEVIQKARNSIDFRAGVIYGVTKRYPSPFQTVDVAITREGKLLLAKKPNEEGWRFIGGFVDSSDTCLEDAAQREATEETGATLRFSNFRYVTSVRVDDWRYRTTKEKIITALFVCDAGPGIPEPTDDIEQLKWVEFKDLYNETIEPEHKFLMQQFISFVANSI